MSMLMPMRRGRDLMNELLTDPFDALVEAASPFQKMAPNLMRTDIKETDDGYELVIDLPGYKKDNVEIELKDGYMTVNAATTTANEETSENGTFVRKERFSGKCSRSFYVGEDVEQDDIKARFQDGILQIDVPKKQEQAKTEEKKTITIEG